MKLTHRQANNTYTNNFVLVGKPRDRMSPHQGRQEIQVEGAIQPNRRRELVILLIITAASSRSSRLASSSLFWVRMTG